MADSSDNYVSCRLTSEGMKGGIMGRRTGGKPGTRYPWTPFAGLSLSITTSSRKSRHGAYFLMKYVINRHLIPIIGLRQFGNGKKISRRNLLSERGLSKGAE
jgi:hypothetical protein